MYEVAWWKTNTHAFAWAIEMSTDPHDYPTAGNYYITEFGDYELLDQRELPHNWEYMLCSHVY